MGCTPILVATWSYRQLTMSIVVQIEDAEAKWRASRLMRRAEEVMCARLGDIQAAKGKLRILKRKFKAFELDKGVKRLPWLDEAGPAAREFYDACSGDNGGSQRWASELQAWDRDWAPNSGGEEAGDEEDEE